MSQPAVEFAGDERILVEELVRKLGIPAFHSPEAFQTYCRSLVSSWRSETHPRLPSPQFFEHRELIEREAEGAIRTAWGGINVTSVQPPNVEQYVAIDAGCYLPFEKHQQKVESFLARTGLGVIVYKPANGGSLVADVMVPGYSITLRPEQEHTIVALEDLLLFERSTDPMNGHGDRIVIYPSE